MLPAPTCLPLTQTCMHSFKMLTLPQSFTSLNLSQASRRGFRNRTRVPHSQSMTIRKRVAEKQDRCIIQMTVKALYQSFMWLEKKK